MKPRLTLLLLALLASLAAPVSRADEADHEQARKALEAGEVMPLRQILDRVEKDYPGQVMEVELEQTREQSREQERPRWIYEIKVLRPGGAVTKLKLDARDGRLLRIKGQGAPLEGNR